MNKRLQTHRKGKNAKDSSFIEITLEDLQIVVPEFCPSVCVPETIALFLSCSQKPSVFSPTQG